MKYVYSVVLRGSAQCWIQYYLLFMITNFTQIMDLLVMWMNHYYLSYQACKVT